MSPWNSLPQSKANKLEQFQSHLQTLWEEPQSRCPILIAFSRSQSNHSRTHTPSSLNYQFHSVVPGQPNNWGPSNQTCFAGRSWGKILHTSTLWITLMDSWHSSPGSIHPGRQQTLSLLRQRYWWPGMTKDAVQFVRGWDTPSFDCRKSGSTPISQATMVIHQIDFITDLPPSDNHTCILITVDRFTKACHLILLKSLPSATEMAKALFQHLFRNFGIPEDIVSVQGPRFISWVWKSLEGFGSLGQALIRIPSTHQRSNWM